MMTMNLHILLVHYGFKKKFIEGCRTITYKASSSGSIERKKTERIFEIVRECRYFHTTLDL